MTKYSIPLDIRIVGNLSPPDWWTIGLTALATILGAAIGAGIAWIVAQQTASANATAAKAARRELEEAATLRAIVKIIEVANLIAGYHLGSERNMEERRRLYKDHKAHFATWELMLSFAGRPREIHIEADDLIAFTRARQFDYVSRILFLFSRYNAMIYAVEFYGRRRDELMSMITPFQMNGLVGDVATNEAEDMRLAPFKATVADLAEQLRSEMKEVYDLAIVAINDFKPIVRAYFNDPTFPVPTIPRSGDQK